MKNPQDVSIPLTQPGPTGVSRLLRYTKWLWETLEKVKTRRLLAELDDRQLSDMGISHCDRANELDKPFWR
ncbi:DUF1127 domain-containing protein [Pseudomonas vancouverensis]|uniref:DUF1127 domain-containing protein n=1 Tax=Pseudomonas vancouverensis TaxID=95300 RepID=A0A1H2PEW8_PSEVA|nr:DUF1127 domain-containing protein [Pseudomonas vancouverensis]KAB0498005.1 DUF1127 domain-containing protein [Pseudomonas vancouverensis]TDB66732.1 DUF1127 domain-containing protein [Pseudomonas vancouverensis]SDV15556.1 Uncharacterized conserved protein YjiS, DUF1127 family [Pseudomonas vancouverensis]